MIDVRLDQYIQEAAKRPFEWGVFDCALFVSDWCALNGFDPAKEYRGKYNTEIGAKRILAKKAGSLSAAYDEHMFRVGVNFAQKGDVCVTDLESETVGIIAGRGGAWYKTENEGVILLKVKPKTVWRLK